MPECKALARLLPRHLRACSRRVGSELRNRRRKHLEPHAILETKTYQTRVVHDLARRDASVQHFVRPFHAVHEVLVGRVELVRDPFGERKLDAGSGLYVGKLERDAEVGVYVLRERETEDVVGASSVGAQQP